MSHPRCLKILAVGMVLVLAMLSLRLPGFCASKRQDRKARAAQEEKSQQISRLELQNDLMRFAQIFILGLEAKFSFLVDRQQNNAMRFALSDGELRLVNKILTIATGPEPVVNLLDMVIYVTLAHLYVENNWDAERFGKDRGELPAFFKQMEKEIWSIAAKVMIPRYRRELRRVIQRWRKNHPAQFFIEGVGFDALADTLGDAEFKDAAKSGFFLPEVNEATRSVDEARNLAERLVFFVKFLPYILRTTTETGIYDILDQTETIRLLTDIDRLTTAIESIGVTAKNLPDRLSREREKLVKDLVESEGRLRALSADLRQTLVAGNQTAGAANEAIQSADRLVARILERGKPGTFDIQDYITIVKQATETVKQAQVLLSLVDKLSAGPGVEYRLSQLKKGIDALFLRAFLWAALLIVFFFVALLLYRYVSSRFFRESKADL